MLFSVKTFAITVLLALIVGFLGGFIPQHSTATAAARDRDQVQAQLARVQQDATLNSFRNRIAVVYFEAQKKNFAQASNDASGLFTAMQSYSDQTPDTGLRQQLSSLLTSRDAIISGLAKGDDATTAQLQELFLKIQNVGSQGNPGA